MNYKKTYRHIRYPFEIFGILVIFFICKILPLSLVRILGRFLGLLLLLFPKIHKLMMSNLDIAFSGYSLFKRYKIVYLSISNSIMTMLEFFWAYKNYQRLNKILVISEEEKLFFKQNDKGKLFFGLHLGNWEFASIFLGLNSNIDVLSMSKEIKNSFLEKLIYKGRIKYGINLCHTKGAARKFIKELYNKRSVALIFDQNVKKNQGGIWVDYFGLPVLMSKLPAVLIKKFKPEIYLILILRTSKGFKIILENCTDKIDSKKSEKEISQILLSISESYVRKYPEQFVWYYKRWCNISKTLSLKEYPYYAS